MDKLFSRVICALAAAALSACATAPSISAAPDYVAERIGANAVAYNQAYGRAIADQLLLNIMRARDGVPLYYLSMSGINDQSHLEVTRSGTLANIGLGNGNPDWSVGQLTGGATTRIQPGYQLNPLQQPKKDEGPSGRAFEPVSPRLFRQYWRSDWPPIVLLLLLADRMEIYASGQKTIAVENSSNGYNNSRASGAERGCSSSAAQTIAAVQQGDAVRRDCTFYHIATYLDANRDAVEVRLHSCNPPPKPEQTAAGQPAQQRQANQQQPPPRCELFLDYDGRTFRVELRSLDDITFYVGALLRNADMTSPVTIDGDPFFEVHVQDSEAERLIPYAARVSYGGRRVAAGRPLDWRCYAHRECSNFGERSEYSGMVLSLLTQLMVLSQTPSFQEAPESATVEAR